MPTNSETILPKSNLKVLKELWPFMAHYKPQIFGAGIALVVAGGTVLGIVRGLRYVIDQGFVADNPAMLDQTLFELLGAIIILALSTYARYSLVTWLGERITADLRRAVYAHILKLSPEFFEVTRSGDILSRISADVSILQSLIGSSISVSLRNMVLLIGGIAMMLLTSAKLTGFVLLGIPVVIIPIITFGRKVRKLSKATQERVADVAAAAEETVYGIRTVQAFVHEEVSRNAFNMLVEGTVQTAQQHIRARASLTAIVIFLVFSAIGVVLWIGGHDVLSHAITAGQLSAFVGYAAIAAGSTGAISESMGDINRAAGATERIFDLMDQTPAIAAPVHPIALPASQGALQFDNVTFTYPARPATSALQNVSFSVKAGERVAIVGPSGAGKTTIYQLALRFYDPQRGRIMLDGVDIKSADPRDVRAHIGLVPQDPIIFSADAAHNIAYGRPEASEQEIRDAAKAAHADEFLSALPQGYKTFLGEKGVRLSGGQRQRIAIARAILRNPSLLLLDEATSALDAESESLVQDALDKLMHGRTTLIIAHRLATVAKADRILVMDQGQIIATGTHSSLIAEGGLYARLAALQFEKAVA